MNCLFVFNQDSTLKWWNGKQGQNVLILQDKRQTPDSELKQKRRFVSVNCRKLLPLIIDVVS